MNVFQSFVKPILPLNTSFVRMIRSIEFSGVTPESNSFRISRHWSDKYAATFQSTLILSFATSDKNKFISMKLDNFLFLVALLYCAVAMPIDETVVDISDADFTEADFVEYYNVITASEIFLSFVTFPLTTSYPPSAVFSNSTFRMTFTTLIKSCRSVLLPPSHRAECVP
jgi:hypothetical protein